MTQGRPGARITADGSPVDVYTRLPLDDDVEIVAAHCSTGGSVLDLGAGGGRVADPLACAGFSVTAVDDSVEMLSQVTKARTVCCRIEDLTLNESFDVVLLSSHLVNTPDHELRHALLSTAAQHAKVTGRVLIQRHPPEWFDA
ncbi:MAG: class I SAM-dependent methyltransferase [Actinomycetes bacterium]